MLQNGYIVSFTFIGGSQDEVEDQIEGLNFSPLRQPNRSSATAPKK
jgi:hypothetical protein